MRCRVVPASAVPMPPEIGRRIGYHHVVPGAGRDRSAATGAGVVLARLVRLDPPNLQRPEPDLVVLVGLAHRHSAEQGPGHERDADEHARGHVEVVEARALVLPGRVESHERSMPYRRAGPGGLSHLPVMITTLTGSRFSPVAVSGPVRPLGCPIRESAAPCLPQFVPPRSVASTGVGSPSRSTCPTAFPATRSSACPTRRVASRATVFAPRCCRAPIPGPRPASSSISRRPACPRWARGGLDETQLTARLV